MGTVKSDYVLCEGGAQYDISVTLSGVTALVLAAVSGHATCVQALLQAGANADAEFEWVKKEQILDGPGAGRSYSSPPCKCKAEDVAQSEDLKLLLKQNKVLSLT